MPTGMVKMFQQVWSDVMSGATGVLGRLLETCKTLGSDQVLLHGLEVSILELARCRPVLMANNKSSSGYNPRLSVVAHVTCSSDVTVPACDHDR
jgi:hypothetical protein